MTTPEQDPSFEDAMKAIRSLRSQRDYHQLEHAKYEGMLREWACKIVMYHHMPIARAAKFAGVHRRTMTNWVNEARAFNGYLATKRPADLPQE